MIFKVVQQNFAHYHKSWNVIIRQQIFVYLETKYKVLCVVMILISSNIVEPCLFVGQNLIIPVSNCSRYPDNDNHKSDSIFFIRQEKENSPKFFPKLFFFTKLSIVVV